MPSVVTRPSLHATTVYEDTLPGLAELAKYGIVVTLSNGNYRLLVDMVSKSLREVGRRGDHLVRQRTSNFRGTESCRPSSLGYTSRAFDPALWWPEVTL